MFVFYSFILFPNSFWNNFREQKLLNDKNQPLMSLNIGNGVYQPGAKLDDVEEDEEEQEKSEAQFSTDNEDNNSEISQSNIDYLEEEIKSTFNEFAIINKSNNNNNNINSNQNTYRNNEDNLNNLNSYSIDPELGELLMSPTAKTDRTEPTVLPIRSLRVALIQILNRLITHQQIQILLEDLGLETVDSLYYSEFHLIYEK